MLKIGNNFCGYLNVGNDKFVFNITKSLVTLLPAESDPKKIEAMLSRLRSHDTDHPEFFFGNDGNSTIAFERNTNFSMDVLQLSPIVRFRTPIIIKAAGNTHYFKSQLTAEWDCFHAITFFGGNINAIFPPAIARKPRYSQGQVDGEEAIAIELQPSSYYSHSTEIEIDGTKSTLTVSLYQTEGTNEEHMNSYNVGELSAYVRISFDEAQKFEKIERYYQIIYSLIAILTAQNNVVFNVYLSQKEKDGLFHRTGVCKIFDSFQNYSVRKSHKVIQILSVFDHIPKIVESIAVGKAQSILDVLPDDNANINRISITNVQDLCTALEIIYNENKHKRPKDTLIEELKASINDTISAFVQSKLKQGELEISIQDDTNIASAFKYLDFTLTDKILTLYSECQSIIDGFIAHKSLPQINESRVRSFVRLRNNKTHNGEIEWGDNAATYVILLALLYASFLKNVGVNDDIIQQLLVNVF